MSEEKGKIKILSYAGMRQKYDRVFRGTQKKMLTV